MSRRERSFDTTEFTLSFSSLESFSQCPRKWYLRYIKKIYPDIKQDHTEFGNLIHKIAEEYNGSGRKEIKRLFNKFKDDYDIDYKKYSKRIKLALNNLDTFFNVYLKTVKNILTEKEFRFPLNEIFDLTGKIDLMCKSGNEWIIHDWKTSKNKKDQSKQLASYFFMLRWVAEKRSKKMPNKIRARIVYLCLESEEDDPDEFVDEYVIDLDDVEMIDNILKTTMRRINFIKQSDETKWRKKCGPLCDYCDYKKEGYCDGKEDKPIEQQIKEVVKNV